MPDPALAPIDRKVIFVCGDRSFTGREVIEAALFRGEVAPEWKNLQRLLAAERRADEQNLDFDDDAIDSAVEQFRYEHDLITAEETEQWLAERGLTLGDFTDYFVRRYWGAQFEDATGDELDYLTAPNDTPQGVAQ